MLPPLALDCCCVLSVCVSFMPFLFPSILFHSFLHSSCLVPHLTSSLTRLPPHSLLTPPHTFIYSLTFISYEFHDSSISLLFSSRPILFAFADYSLWSVCLNCYFYQLTLSLSPMHSLIHHRQSYSYSLLFPDSSSSHSCRRWPQRCVMRGNASKPRSNNIVWHNSASNFETR